MGIVCETIVKVAALVLVGFTSTRGNLMSAVYTAQTAVNMTRTIFKAVATK